jgi:hypothetical protein
MIVKLFDEIGIEADMNYPHQHVAHCYWEKKQPANPAGRKSISDKLSN